METTMTPREAFIESLRIVGSQGALAEIVGKRQGAISKRLSGKGTAQPEEVLAIEAATGVSKHLLRPDIYPLDATQIPAPSATVEGDRSMISHWKDMA